MSLCEGEATKKLDGSETLWSLEQLSQLSQRELELRKIPSPGGRVSQTLSARTIRYYTSLGLVDRPSSYDGGIAKYGPRHLLQLLAIKVLQAEYLPLPEIQKQLFGRNESDLNQVIQASTRTEDLRESQSLPRNETWLTRRVIPGLRFLVDDRDKLLEWVKSHSGEDTASQIRAAVDDLLREI